jgi:hypothetical protein
VAVQKTIASRIAVLEGRETQLAQELDAVQLRLTKLRALRDNFAKMTADDIAALDIMLEKD